MIIGNPKEKIIPANFPVNKLFDLEESEINNDCKIVMDWFENFLAKPHSHLGREGHICPYIQNAVKANSIWITNINEVSNLQQIEKFISDCLYFFRALPKTNPKDDLLNCLLIVFSANGGESVFELIDNIQSKLKPNFVKEGLMIGEFYKSNTKPGLHNSNFHPLQSPIPILAIRNIVESDLLFLTVKSDHPKLRVQYITAYLDFLSNKLSQTKLNEAKSALAEAIAELNLILS